MAVTYLGHVGREISYVKFMTEFFASVDAWVERFEQRRTLAELDDRMLRDIGVTKGEAMREADKRFWIS